MRVSRLSMILFAAVCPLLLASRAAAQHAYGYASIDIDPSTNTVTGYASTEVDYDVAAYYNAEVQAQIEDQNGNIIASGSNSDYQSASVTLGAGDILQCVTYRIISYLILDAIIFDDCGYVDVYGFGYLPFNTWWGYADFWNDRWLCRWEPFIRIAELIDTVTECISAHVSCGQDTTRVLPSLDLQGTQLRPGMERQWITLDPGMTGSNNMTINCSAVDDFGQPVSNVLITFSFNTAVAPLNDGGHQNHAGPRPNGILKPTSVRTDSSGNAHTTFTSSPFSGSSLIEVNANGSFVYAVNIDAVVPGLQELFGGTNYVLIGSDNYHPSNHWVKPDVITSLHEIADTYANQFYPNGFPPHTPPLPGQTETDYYKVQYNDCSLPLGGKFDIRPVPPRWNVQLHHDEHRVGINCDVRIINIPTAQRAELKQIFFDKGSTETKLEGNPPHWHLRFYRGAQVAASEDLSPYNGTPAAIPGQIQAEEFDIGDYGNAYFVPAADNRPGNTPMFSNDPLVPGVTGVKAAHITELREAIDQVRARFGRSPYSWQYSATTNDYISANPIIEMRAALDEAIGPPSGGYTPGLGTGLPILKDHIQELRDRVKAAADSGVDDSVWPEIDTYDASDGSTSIATVSGQWSTYTINVIATDTYTFTARVASPYAGSMFHVEVDGANKTGPISIPNTGSSDAYQLVSVENISLEAGQHVMTVVIDSGGAKLDYFLWSLSRPCNPSQTQLQGCWRRGGDWDYDSCTCTY